MMTHDILKDMYSTYMSIKKSHNEVELQATKVSPKKEVSKDGSKVRTN